MIKLIKSSFYNESETKKKLADFVIGADIFSMSAQCKEFEKVFAQKQVRKYAVFVNSGSSANLILIQALINLGKLKKGDKVGFSALTWPTNIMPLLQLGLDPVAIDCEIESLNISPKTLDPYIKDLKALFITNVLGFSDDIQRIEQMCQKAGVMLLEDNCESLGSQVNGKLLGNFSLASTFSFFVGHHLSTIEGGMLCTDDEMLYYELIKVRAHGWDRNLPVAEQERLRGLNKVQDFYAKYTFYDLAYNCRPTEINGFLGIIAVGFWDEIVAKRAHNFERFSQAVAANNALIDIKTDHMDVISNFAMPVIARDPSTFDTYRKRFEDADVEIRPVIAGDMTLQPFYERYVKQRNSCKNAQYIHKNGFYFGNNPEMSDEEVALLVKLLQP